MIELMPEYQYKKLNKLIKIEDNNYIIYDLETKKFEPFQNIDEVKPLYFVDTNNYQVANKI